VFVGVVGEGWMVAHNETVTTSIVRLLADPEAYNRKKVHVMGYYASGRNQSGIFLTKEAAETGNVQLAIWVSFPDPAFSIGSEEVERGFVEVTGIFRPDRHGHVGMWPAEIDSVESLHRVASRGQAIIMTYIAPVAMLLLIGATIFIFEGKRRMRNVLSDSASRPRMAASR
jgi:hypothetical protein